MCFMKLGSYKTLEDFLHWEKECQCDLTSREGGEACFTQENTAPRECLIVMVHTAVNKALRKICIVLFGIFDAPKKDRSCAAFCLLELSPVALRRKPSVDFISLFSGPVNAEIIVTDKEPFLTHQIVFYVLGSQ